MEPGPGAVFDQRRDVDSDPPGLQRVVFLRDDSLNAVPRRRGEAGGEAVRNLADGGFPLGVAHYFSVIQACFGVNQKVAVHRSLTVRAYAEEDPSPCTEGAAMSFEGKSGRKVRGSELRRGQEVRVRVGDQDLGIGIVDEVTADGGGAVWIFFSGSAPRRVPTDDGSTEFTVPESKTRLA